MKEYKYQAILYRAGYQYQFKFYAESKELAMDHASHVARFGSYNVITVKRMPSNSDMTDAGQIVLLC